MEKEYNWKKIMLGSVPVSIIMYFVFTSSMTLNLKWFYLVLGMIAASGITYIKDKKKQNVFTSGFVVLLVALIVHGLRNLGFL